MSQELLLINNDVNKGGPNLVPYLPSGIINNCTMLSPQENFFLFVVFLLTHELLRCIFANKYSGFHVDFDT